MTGKHVSFSKVLCQYSHLINYKQNGDERSWRISRERVSRVLSFAVLWFSAFHGSELSLLNQLARIYLDRTT